MQINDQQLLLQFVEALRSSQNAAGSAKQVRLSLPEQGSKSALQRQRRRRYVEETDRGPDTFKPRPLLSLGDSIDRHKLQHPAQIGRLGQTHLDRLQARLSRTVEQLNRLEQQGIPGDHSGDDGGSDEHTSRTWRTPKSGLGKGSASGTPFTLAAPPPSLLSTGRHGRGEQKMTQTGATVKVSSSPSNSSSPVDADDGNQTPRRTAAYSEAELTP